jgi:replicative DNA helicase
MCNSSLNTAKLNESNLVFSLEMSNRILTARYWALETGIPITDILSGRINQKQLDQVYEAVKKIKDLPLYMTCSFTPSLEYVLATIRQYKKDKDIKRVYVDYLQLLSARDDDQTAELGRITRALKLLAEELGIVIIILSQLNRMLETRPDKRPILSDLRQSGNIEEDVDMAGFLYRDVIYNSNTKDKNIMEFLLRKNRNGPIGMVALKFDDPTNIITGGR